MFKITAEEVKEELYKIAFLIQNSQMFKDFKPKTRKVLESLPVEWSQPELSGEVKLEWEDSPSWQEANIPGKFQDSPISLNIKRTNDRFFYKLNYKGKTYTVENLDKLRILVMDLQEGGVSKPEIMKSVLDELNHKKNQIVNYASKYYIGQVSKKPWKIKIDSDPSRIYVKFLIDVADDSKRQEVIDFLSNQDDWRINSIGTYLKEILKKSDIDIADLKFTQRLTSKQDQTGFNITIAY